MPVCWYIPVYMWNLNENSEEFFAALDFFAADSLVCDIAMSTLEFQGDSPIFVSYIA